MTDLLHREARRAIIEACLRIEAEGVNQSTSGNVSTRIPEGFLITRSGLPYEATLP
jgi:L-fuculose-phosphate aldolase